MKIPITIRLGSSNYTGFVAAEPDDALGLLTVSMLPQNAESLYDIASAFGKGLTCAGAVREEQWTLCVLRSCPKPDEYRIEVTFRARKTAQPSAFELRAAEGDVVEDVNDAELG